MTNTEKKENDIFNDYKKWYNEHAQKSGGLILQATAARLLNTPRQNINRMVKIGKLKTYQYKPEYEIYIGLNEIEQIIKKRLEKVKDFTIGALISDGIFKVEHGVNISEMPNDEVDEWAEEWNLHDNETNFQQFIETRFNAWKKKNPDHAKILKNEAEQDTHIYQLAIGTYADNKRGIVKLKFEKPPKE